MDDLTSASVQDESGLARARLTQVFEYLRALHQHRNPAVRQVASYPWTLRLRDLPLHESVLRGWLEGVPAAINEDSGDGEFTLPDDYILRVRRPRLTAAPSPAQVLDGWIDGEWRDPSRSARLRPLPSHPPAPDEESPAEVNERLERERKREEDHRTRERAFALWQQDHWNPWAESERPTRAAMEVFEALYDLYGRMQREAERLEIIVGDGMLTWRSDSGGVGHPLVLQRLQLEFDPDVPQFTLAEADYPVEFYSAIGQALPSVDAEVLIDCREELEKAPVHPLSGEAADEYLRRVVNRLSPSEGQFVGAAEVAGESSAPRIGRDPYVFLRTRTLGYGLAIERILEDLQTSSELPHPIWGAVGIDAPHSGAEDGDREAEAGWHEPSDVLLSKPANPEQVRIAQRLESRWNVLVQGPPGTGKTHTIANLLGHLLAQGKSVLVTSHTTKSLRVLRHQVVDALKPLCVSVLDSDAESRQELEESVRAIIERLGTSDADRLRGEGARLQQERTQVLDELSGRRAEMLEARLDEYRAIVVGGEAFEPSAAARQVREEVVEHGWIPGPVVLGAPLPFSVDEASELYRTNGAVTKQDEVELDDDLPHPDQLIAPSDFENLLAELDHIEQQDLDIRDDLWMTNACKIGSFDPVLARITRVVGGLESLAEWQLEVMSAGAATSAERALWEDLVGEIEALRRKAIAARELIFRHGPRLSAGAALGEQVGVLRDIQAHLQAGGSLGALALVIRPTWKRLIGAWQVSGEPPREPEHFAALEKLADLILGRQRLAARWDLQIAPLGAPGSADLGEEVERAAERFIPLLRRALDWHTMEWTPLEAELRSLGFQWDALLAEQIPRLDRHGDLLRLCDAVRDHLPPILASRAAFLRRAEVLERLDSLRRILDGFGSTRVVVRLRIAAQERDPAGYGEAYQRLTDLHQRSSDLRRRRELLQVLTPLAPGWVAAIQQRISPHDGVVPPGNVRKAWLWRQLHDELVRRGGVSLSALQEGIRGLSLRLRTRTAELIDRRAWEAQVRRTTLRQQQALMGYRGVIRKIGKGTGLRAPKLKAEAQRLMAECRGAVPVWIMPLARVADSFDPRTTRFDVVIIDEASQCDMLGLIAVYLGKKVIVVGDDEQVSPDAVGQRVEEVERLIALHLKGIPNSLLYDGQRSIYDLANESFGSPIRLVEHFRCVPEIIQFSNYLSYGGTVKPLRDASDVLLRPHTVAHHVHSAAYDERSKTNREEAETVAALIAAAVEQPEYQNKTFGVISMVGDSQALLIEQLLRSRLTPQQYAQHRLLCGNASQFQGDERDVMFLSLVHAADTEGTLRLVSEGFLDAIKKRYNVAASRARDQMWVVHSMDPALHLKPGDMRLRLIKHAQDPDSTDRRMERAAEHAESPFEREVQERLIAAGYGVIPQWKVGHFRIDMVVEGKHRRLAVECDGGRFHPPEQLPDDMARQAILERLGWQFVRIRGSHFFRDPDAAMEPVLARIREMGIEPSAGDVDMPGSARETELLDRVRRRAAELRHRLRPDDACERGMDTVETESGSSVTPHEDGISSRLADTSVVAMEESSKSTAPKEAVLPLTSAEPVPSERDIAVSGASADPQAVASAVQPYQRAECPFDAPAPERFNSDMDVLRSLFHVVQAEAPMHIDLALRRTAEFFGAQRVGRQIREKLLTGVDRLVRGQRLLRRGDFLWLVDQIGSPLPVRTISEDGYVRSISEIPPEEIAAAAEIYRSRASEGSDADLVTGVARLLGFHRTGGGIRDRIESVLRSADTGNIPTAHGRD